MRSNSLYIFLLLLPFIEINVCRSLALRPKLPTWFSDHHTEYCINLYLQSAISNIANWKYNNKLSDEKCAEFGKWYTQYMSNTTGKYSN